VAVAPRLAGQMEDESARRLTPRAEPDLPAGKYAFVEGEAGRQPHRFYLENLSILQPITVTLIARNPGDEIRLELGKYRFDQPDRTAATGSDGVVFERLRTQGELKIGVSAEGGPKPYLLSVWVGDEIEAELPPVLVAAKDYGGDSGSSGFALGGSPVLWVIAAALLVIVGLLAKMAFGKRGRS